MLTRIAQLKLPPDVKNKRLLDYLSGRFTYNSREQWQEAISAGRVTIDGVTATLDTPLAWNQILRYFPPEKPEPPVNTDVQLLFANEDYIVLNKPWNLPCHPAGGFFQHTLWALLKEGLISGLPSLDEIHFISRIDRETSGIVLLAQTGAFHTRAMKMLHSPDTRKIYRVVVHGICPNFIQADGWLYHDPASLVDKKRSFSYEKPAGIPAEEARSSCRKLAYSNGMSEMEVSLDTGRFHQIRATMCSLGFPVLGDKIYGLDEQFYLRFSNHCLTEEDQARLCLPHQALHAWKLHFDGRDFTAPLPADWPILKNAASES